MLIVCYLKRAMGDYVPHKVLLLKTFKEQSIRHRRVIDLVLTAQTVCALADEAVVLIVVHYSDMGVRL